MESSSGSTVLTWLKSLTSRYFNVGNQYFSRHTEVLFPEDSFRYRLIFSSTDAEERVTQWLTSIGQDMSLGLISRQNGLHCIEICTETELADALQAAFDSEQDIELFRLDAGVPVLNSPGVLVMDMDSTAIEIECIDELAEMAGVGAEVAAVTERAMLGELDFEQSLRARVAQLTGADAGIIDSLCNRLPLMPGLVEMLGELKSHGWHTVVASGGFTPFVYHLKQLLNLDDAFANELVIESGRLAGQVSGRVVDAQFKADTVLASAEKWAIPAGQRVAIGDGANDIPMIVTADYGIAYHAKPKLAQAADINIARLDLKVLPYLFQLK